MPLYLFLGARGDVVVCGSDMRSRKLNFVEGGRNGELIDRPLHRVMQQLYESKDVASRSFASKLSIFFSESLIP